MRITMVVLPLSVVLNKRRMINGQLTPTRKPKENKNPPPIHFPPVQVRLNLLLYVTVAWISFSPRYRPASTPRALTLRTNCD